MNVTSNQKPNLSKIFNFAIVVETNIQVEKLVVVADGIVIFEVVTNHDFSIKTTNVSERSQAIANCRILRSGLDQLSDGRVGSG